jgi:hypothetical protein
MRMHPSALAEVTYCHSTTYDTVSLVTQTADFVAQLLDLSSK